MTTEAVLSDWKWWKPFRATARYEALREVADLAFDARMAAMDAEENAEENADV